VEIAKTGVCCEAPGKFRIANHVGRAIVNLAFIEKHSTMTKLLMWRVVGLINGAINDIFGKHLTRPF
jgi:hypothetical protein